MKTEELEKKLEQIATYKETIRGLWEKVNALEMELSVNNITRLKEFKAYYPEVSAEVLKALDAGTFNLKTIDFLIHMALKRNYKVSAAQLKWLNNLNKVVDITPIIENVSNPSDLNDI